MESGALSKPFVGGCCKESPFTTLALHVYNHHNIWLYLDRWQSTSFLFPSVPVSLTEKYFYYLSTRPQLFKERAREVERIALSSRRITRYPQDKMYRLEKSYPLFEH